MKNITPEMKEKIQLGSKSALINRLFEDLSIHSNNAQIHEQIKKMKEIKFSHGYYSGYNIVKYLIRTNSKRTKNFSSIWTKILNASVVSLITFILYSTIIKFDINRPFSEHLHFHLITETMAFYHLYKYILKIINIIKIKASCLSQVFYMFKLKNQTIFSVLMEETESKNKKVKLKDKHMLTINYTDDYSL